MEMKIKKLPWLIALGMRMCCTMRLSLDPIYLMFISACLISLKAVTSRPKGGQILTRKDCSSPCAFCVLDVYQRKNVLCSDIQGFKSNSVFVDMRFYVSTTRMGLMLRAVCLTDTLALTHDYPILSPLGWAA